MEESATQSLMHPGHQLLPAPPPLLGRRCGGWLSTVMSSDLFCSNEATFPVDGIPASICCCAFGVRVLNTQYFFSPSVYKWPVTVLTCLCLKNRLHCSSLELGWGVFITCPRERGALSPQICLLIVSETMSDAELSAKVEILC